MIRESFDGHKIGANNENLLPRSILNDKVVQTESPSLTANRNCTKKKQIC